MKAVPKGIFAAAPFLIGTLLLLCALTFYYFAVLKIDYRESWLLDLGHSDATEYFAQAKALLKDGWPSLQIGYDKLPSTYPLGYPVLMLPWLKILPEPDSILAPFRTNQTIGLLLLLATFGFYAYLAMPLTGGFAATNTVLHMDPKLDISTAGIPPKRSVGAISLFLRKSGSIYCDAAEPDHHVKEQNQHRGFWHADS
jgi:hypothetical protein